MLSEEVSKILKPLYKYRRFVVFISGLHIIVGLLPPFLMSFLIDELNMHVNGDYSFIFIIGTIVGLLIIVFFLGWLQRYLWANLINRGAGILRGFIFSSVLHKNYRFFKEHPVGDINNKVVNDTHIYIKSKLVMIPTLVLNLINIVVIFGFLLVLDVQMKLMTLILSLLFFILYIQINSFLQKHSVREREAFSNMMTEANDTLTGIDAIQLYAAENYVASHFEVFSDTYERRLSKLKYWQALSNAAANILTYILPVAVILTGIFYLTLGGDITIGTVIAFYYLIPRLNEPIKALTDFNLDLQNSKAVENRLEELLTVDIREQVQLDKVDSIEEVEFKDTGFYYPDGETILKDVNVKLQRGDSLAVIGSSGTGKTTLIRLLMRQVIPSEGEITINGKNYTDTDPKSYISRIAVMPQDVFVFDSTLHENIDFGGSYPEKRIRDAAKMSAIDHFSMDERARGVSGGERQRIGLARALARDFDVLILDEPTAELDNETEGVIIKNLQQMQQETNCIMIVVTHSANILEKLCKKTLELPKH